MPDETLLTGFVRADLETIKAAHPSTVPLHREVSPPPRRRVAKPAPVARCRGHVNDGTGWCVRCQENLGWLAEQAER